MIILQKKKVLKAIFLEYPQFTKPKNWEGKGTPDVLLSGDHAKIKAGVYHNLRI